ncbi:MAG: sulfurtransferase [Micropruina sp.]|nr:MAG: sulfurtransferase [Micropruina sp.]
MSRADVLISAEDLAGSLSEVDLLDVRWRLGEPAGAGRERYLAAHLPGARFLDLESVLTRHGAPSDGRHPLPSAAQLAAGLGALGVGGHRPIVVYDEPGSFAAGRAWWVLAWAGLEVRVLDGGITAWLAEGRPVESGDVVAAPVRLSLTTGHLPIVDADGAAEYPGAGVLVDVRAPERYRGETEPIDPVAGHIPGAVNLPVAGFFAADGRLPGDLVLDERLAATKGREVAVYCGSGVSAAQVILALAARGRPAALYPGSWSAWSNDPSRPVATGSD